MAKKHFDEYYNSIYKQLIRLQDSLDGMSEDVSKKLIEPERLEQLKKTIQPIKSSYDMLTYVKYLLDMPNRSSKTKKYKNQQTKVLKQTEQYTAENIQKQNQQTIKKITL